MNVVSLRRPRDLTLYDTPMGLSLIHISLDGAREEDQGYLLGEAARMEARAQGLVLSGPSAEAEALARLAAQIRLLVERKCLR